MSKWIKRVLGLAAVGSAAAGLYFYLKKQGNAFNLLLFYPNKAIINRIT